MRREEFEYFVVAGQFPVAGSDDASGVLTGPIHAHCVAKFDAIDGSVDGASSIGRYETALRDYLRGQIQAV